MRASRLLLVLLPLTLFGCDRRGGAPSGPSPNELPVAFDEVVQTDEETSVVIELRGEDPDGDEDGYTLVFDIVDEPAFGTLEPLRDGGDDDDSAADDDDADDDDSAEPAATPSVFYIYTPELDYEGEDSFTFQVVDEDGDPSEAPATVSISVAGVNDTPIANPDSFTVAEDGSVAITLTGSDVDGDTLQFEVPDPPARGTLDGVPPNLTYVPDPDYFGTDSFPFVVHDGTEQSLPATIDITVTSVNDLPEAFGTALIAAGPVTVSVTGFDPEGASLTFVIDSPAGTGTLGSFISTGPDSADIEYTPLEGWQGDDSFTFYVDDGEDISASATVDITVISLPFEVFGFSTFDTDTGQLDGVVHDGWNAALGILEVGEFTIGAGASLTVIGSQPFLVDAAGAVDISGVLDVSGGPGVIGGGCDNPGGAGGFGGPGGFDGGAGGGAIGNSSLSGVDGDGPGGGAGANTVSSATAGAGGGGGHASTGGAGTGSGGTSGGSAYASLPPMIGGSGGGGGSEEEDSPLSASDGGSGGGGGGGVVSILGSSSISVSGTIDASGGAGGASDCGGGPGGGGAGGAVELWGPSAPLLSGNVNISGGLGPGSAGSGSSGNLVTSP